MPSASTVLFAIPAHQRLHLPVVEMIDDKERKIAVRAEIYTGARDRIGAGRLALGTSPPFAGEGPS